MAPITHPAVSIFHPQVMTADDSMSDDVFEMEEDTSAALSTGLTPLMGQPTTTPSPTGYRDYKPPAEVLDNSYGYSSRDYNDIRSSFKRTKEDDSALTHKVSFMEQEIHTYIYGWWIFITYKYGLQQSLFRLENGFQPRGKWICRLWEWMCGGFARLRPDFADHLNKTRLWNITYVCNALLLHLPLLQGKVCHFVGKTFYSSLFIFNRIKRPYFLSLPIIPFFQTNFHPEHLFPKPISTPSIPRSHLEHISFQTPFSQKNISLTRKYIYIYIYIYI